MCKYIYISWHYVQRVSFNNLHFFNICVILLLFIKVILMYDDYSIDYDSQDYSSDLQEEFDYQEDDDRRDSQDYEQLAYQHYA